jgi:peptidoglycan lytic transglycosylase
MMRFFRGIWLKSALLLLAAALSTACAETAVSPSRAAAIEPAPAAVPDQVYRETGTAEWYGKERDGRKAADGETFDMNALVAAHRTLPLGTIIRVTDLDNYKSVRVTVIDRGPFVRSRILGLSLGAARKLGFVDQGAALVKIETLGAVRDAAFYTVQAAAYTEQENARLLEDRLRTKFEKVFIVPFETNLARLYCVRVGVYASEELAELVASRLTREGLEPIVLRKD